MRDYLAKAPRSVPNWSCDPSESSKSSDVSFVISRVKRWIDIDQRDDGGLTLLEHAINIGNLDGMQSLLIHGAHPQPQSAGRLGTWKLLENKKHMERWAGPRHVAMSYRLALERPLDLISISGGGPISQGTVLDLWRREMNCRPRWKSQNFEKSVRSSCLTITIPMDNVSCATNVSGVAHLLGYCSIGNITILFLRETDI